MGERISIRKTTRGSALVASLGFVLIMSIAVGYVTVATQRQTRNNERSRLLQESLMGAGTLLKSMSEQAYYMANVRPSQAQGNVETLLNTVLPMIKPAAAPGMHIPKSGSKAMSFFKPHATNNGVGRIIDDPNHRWDGYMIKDWAYDTYAFVNESAPNDPTKPSVNATRLGFKGAGFKTRLNISHIPLFQFAIFYNGDLELHPGPYMKIDGPVHTNSDLWVASGGGLDFNARVSAVGNFRNYRSFRDDHLKINAKSTDPGYVFLETSDHTAEVKFKNLADNAMNSAKSGLPAGTDTNSDGYLDSNDGNWLSKAINRWAGNLSDSAMGNRPIRPPLPFLENGKQADPSELIQRVKTGDPADLKKQKFETMAKVKIYGEPVEMNASNPTLPKNLTIKVASAGDPLAPTTYVDIPNKIGTGTPIVTIGTFWDGQQKATVRTLDVNMAELKNRAGIDWGSSSGVVYVSTNGNQDGTLTGSNGTLNAVRMHNAASLPKNSQNGFTFATDRPLYTQGDINDSGTRVTSLLAADSITITSQKLTTELTKNGSSNVVTKANATETNSIFLLGNAPSLYADANGKTTDANGVQYNSWKPGLKRVSQSGGAHNVLRYLENWSGINHTYYGSLICLFKSQIATKPYRNDNKYYDAPTRSYNWDTNLKTAVAPTGMPNLIEVQTTTLERINYAEAVAAANAS